MPAPPVAAEGPHPSALRRAVLAVSVLHDVDIEPLDGGVRLPGRRPVSVPWATLGELAGPHDPDGGVGRLRIATGLLLLRRVAELGDGAAAALAEQARPLALAADHALHPGPGWARDRVLGGVLELGSAVQGVLDDPDAVLPLPAEVARAAGVDTGAWWPRLRRRAEAMGELAVRRLRREAPPAGPGSRRRVAVLRPVGGCDVPTLLASATLRGHLAAGDGSGMRALAVPARSRGWYDLARIDPAFVAAAWSATDPADRGLPRPLLVTADEVVLAAARGDLLAGRGPDRHDAAAPP